MRHNQYCLQELINIGVVSPIPESNVERASDADIDAALEHIYKQRISVNEEHPIILQLVASIESLVAEKHSKELLLEWLGILREGFINGKAKYEGSTDLESLITHTPGASYEISIYQIGIKAVQAKLIVLEQELQRVRGLLTEIPSPEWFPEVNDNLINLIKQRGGITRDALFGIDLALCVEYLRALNLIPICDCSVQLTIIKNCYPTKCSKYLSIFNHVVITGMDTLASVVAEDSRIVWISCGTQFGLPIGYDTNRFSSVMTDGRIYGIVWGSALNGGYAGLSLYKWNSKDWSDRKFGREIVKFVEGKVIYGTT